MLEGGVFQQDLVWIGLGALAIVISLWLLKTVIKWLFILAIVGLGIWHFWLA